MINSLTDVTGQVLETQLQFLRDAKIDGKKHSDKSLLHHLLGTRNLLAEWGARPALYDAGLFHSVYGTESFKVTSIPMSKRETVREVIGDEAEHLAWLFSVMRKQTLLGNLDRSEDLKVQSRLTEEWLPLDRHQFSDLVNLMIANSIEQLPRLPKRYAVSARSFLMRFRAHAMPAAQRALDEFSSAVDHYAQRKWWQFWK